MCRVTSQNSPHNIVERRPIWNFFFFASKPRVVTFTAASRSVVYCSRGRRQARGFSVLRFWRYFTSVFRFGCLFRFSWILRVLAFAFGLRQKYKRNFGIFSGFLPCEWQLSASTDLEQPRNANVIKRNT